MWLLVFLVPTLFIASGICFKIKKNPLGAIFLTVAVLASFFLETELTDATIEKEMRRRLNEPVVSEQQLYGYEILNKRYLAGKDTVKKLEKSEYSFELGDLISPSNVILKDIKVSEEIYEKYPKGTKFLPAPNENNTSNKDPAVSQQGLLLLFQNYLLENV